MLKKLKNGTTFKSNLGEVICSFHLNCEQILEMNVLFTHLNTETLTGCKENHHLVQIEAFSLHI